MDLLPIPGMVAIRPTLISAATTAIGSIFPSVRLRPPGDSGRPQTGPAAPFQLFPQPNAPAPPANTPRGSLLDLTV